MAPLEETNRELSKDRERGANNEKELSMKQLVELIESYDFVPWTRDDDKESDRELIGERYAQ